MTAEDMAASVGVTIRTVRRIISKLVSKGYIKRVGEDKSADRSEITNDSFVDECHRNVTVTSP